jgi:hypothetical protein
MLSNDLRTLVDQLAGMRLAGEALETRDLAQLERCLEEMAERAASIEALAVADEGRLQTAAEDAVILALRRQAIAAFLRQSHDGAIGMRRGGS